ncbi:MAG: CPBP family glutamic-type intramembrane protease [Chitinispirillia bacterium]|jgi:membrane protease YdiL (CAAX protease family)
MEKFCFNCNKKLHRFEKYNESKLKLCNECIILYFRCKKCGQPVSTNNAKKQETSLLCSNCQQKSALFGTILEKDENFPQIWGSIILFLLLVGLQFFIGFALYFLLLKIGVRIYLGDPTYLSITILLSYLIVIYIGAWKNGKSFQKLFPIENFKVSLLVPLILTAVGLYSLLFTYHFVLNNYAYLERIEFDYFKALIYPNIYSFGLLVLISPVTEELFFRGLLLNGLTRRFDVKHSIALSSLFFAVSHFSVQKLIPIFLLGFFLGWIFVKTKNLLPCILIHAINNCIAFFHSINSEDVKLIELKTGPLFILIFGLLAFSVGSLFLFRNQSSH